MAMNPGGWYRDTRQYLNEVEGEFRKITWPAQKEAVAGTLSVVVVVSIIASVLGVIDFALSWIFGLLLQ